MAPTREQEAALRAMSTRPETAIAAGAGSGKTTLLTEAVWRDLEDESVPLERIVVVAYNRAAAAHLVARLQERFAEGRGRERPGLDLSAAWVGTFHSLAGRIVRDHPFLAGADPEFGELSETESAALMEQALDDAFEHELRRAREPGAGAGLLDLVANARSVDSIRAAVRHVHDRLRAAGMELPQLTLPDAGGPDEGLRKELDGLIERVREHPGARQDHHDGAALAADLLRTDVPGDSPPKLKLNCARELKPIAERFNELSREYFVSLVEQEAQEQLEGFAELLTTCARRYAQLKRRRGALDYEDLLLAALRVLRAGHGYAFARVYVDEFQDANALQDEMVGLLAGERTVLVGDGCQAIYGFRHADSAHFLRRVGTAPAVELRDNHRSQPALLDSLNGVLAEALRDEPSFAPLQPAAEPGGGPPLADPPFELVDVRAERPSRDQEAEALAGVVARLVGRDGYRHREVAVLFRALTAVEPYRAAIAARGIPVHLVAGRGFFDHDQVGDTMALLKLVENPHDEEALVRVLASPYVSTSDEDLVALRRAAGPDGALWPASQELMATAPAAEMVVRLRPLLRERGLPGLVEAAVTERGYDLAVLGLPDGPRRFANLRRLVLMAAQHAAVRGPNLRGFLSLLRTMTDLGNQDPGEATLVDPELDAVRLTTIHGVKGEQFPAVVVADASHAQPQAWPMVIADREGRAGIRVPRAGAGAVSTRAYDALVEELKEEEAAEERRVTYVAATRAQRHVAVVGRSGAWGNVANAAFQVLAEAYGGAGEPVHEFDNGGRAALRAVEAPVPEGDGRRPRTEVPATVQVDAPQPPRAPAVDQVAGRRLSFSALSSFATCPRRFHLERELGLRGRPEAVVGGGGVGESAWGGAALGDLVHAVLERHDWAGPAPRPGWAATAAGSAGLPASAVDAERAERMVADLVASPLAARIAAGGERWAERRFATAVDGAVLSGSIDLLVDEAAGGALLVDWKTHRLAGRPASDVAAEYGLQQALYALAALRAGHERATLLWAVLEDLPGSVERVVTAADIPGLEAEVRAALAGLRDGGRPAAATTPQPFCSGCPGLDALCPVAEAFAR